MVNVGFNIEDILGFGNPQAASQTFAQSAGAAGQYVPQAPTVPRGPGGRSFDEITGTPYLNDAERFWYLAQQVQRTGGETFEPDAISFYNRQVDQANRLSAAQADAPFRSLEEAPTGIAFGAPEQAPPRFDFAGAQAEAESAGFDPIGEYQRAFQEAAKREAAALKAAADAAVRAQALGAVEADFPQVTGPTRTIAPANVFSPLSQRDPSRYRVASEDQTPLALRDIKPLAAVTVPFFGAVGEGVARQLDPLDLGSQIGINTRAIGRSVGEMVAPRSAFDVGVELTPLGFVGDARRFANVIRRGGAEALPELPATARFSRIVETPASEGGARSLMGPGGRPTAIAGGADPGISRVEVPGGQGRVVFEHVESGGKLETRVARDGESVHLLNVSVPENYQRQGIGTRLYRDAFEDVAEKYGPTTPITGDLNSAAAVRIRSRLPGSEFFDSAGNPITSDEAMRLADANQAPTVRTPADAFRRMDEGALPPEVARQDPGPLTQPAATRRPRGRPVGVETPDQIMARVKDSILRGERVDQSIMKLHGGRARTFEAEAQLEVDRGNDLLHELGVGKRVSNTVVPRVEDTQDLDALFKALHGEGEVPARLRPVYEQLRNLTDWEQAARINFDPDQALVSHYFYRGWKPPEGAFIRGTGAKEGELIWDSTFRKPRTGATYQEMRDLGFEPLFWNPFEQWRYSRMQGVRFREQSHLVDLLKQNDVAIPVKHNTAVRDGYRVPEIGPAFEGRPFAIVDGAGEPMLMQSRRWAVPNKLADLLEQMYGKRPNPNKVGGLDPGALIDAAVFLPKRAKLLGSFFQQVDFWTRNNIGSWANMVDALRTGHGLEAATSLARIPGSSMDIARSFLSPSYRRNLQEQLLSTAPLLSGRKLNMRMISEAGLSVQDYTILPKNIDEIAREVGHEVFGAKIAKAPLRAIKSLEEWSRRGLFKGVYPAAVMTDVRNNIVPMLARQFPNASDAKLASMAAQIANIKYSTIPVEQSFIQNKAARDFLTRFFFSMGETEGLLRQGFHVAKGPNKLYWAEHWLGAALGLSAIANTIHFASTGELLPWDRYVPISKDGYGPLPFGYNRDFLSPDIPLTGRSGTKLTLDIVGQLDTVFRLLDPLGFVSSRESVPVRAAYNQIRGEDFYGAPIDTVGPDGIISRTTQLAWDMFAPIGIGAASLEVARNKLQGMEGVLPEGESRLGVTGSLVQGTGINLRAETTPQLMDRATSEYRNEDGEPFKNDEGKIVSKYDDLEPYQKDQLEQSRPDLFGPEGELTRRTSESARQGSEGAQFRIEMERVDKDRLDAEAAAVKRLREGGDTVQSKTTFREEITTAQRDAAIERAAIDSVYQRYRDDEEYRQGLVKKASEGDVTAANRVALFDYYESFDQAKAQFAEGSPEYYDEIDRIHSALQESWTDKQKAYVDRNTGLTKHPDKEVKEYLQARDTLQPYLGASKLAWSEYKKFIPYVADDELSQAVKEIALRSSSFNEFKNGLDAQIRQWSIEIYPEWDDATREQETESLLNKILRGINIQDPASGRVGKLAWSGEGGALRAEQLDILVKNPEMLDLLAEWYPHRVAEWMFDVVKAGKAQQDFAARELAGVGQ